MNFILTSPLDQFDINNFLSINFPIIGNIQLSITNFGFYSLLTFILILCVFLGANNKEQLISNR